MCSEYYIDNLNGLPNKWFIDTCSIMKHWKLAKFVDRKQLLLDSGIKIVVIKPVYEELLKHQDSLDESKAENACIGFKLIENNQDLFEIQGYNQETRCDEAFADRSIIETLTLNQKNGIQVFITDDLNLAHDAYELNNRRSYKSNKIYVCWIDYDGELQRSIAAHDETPVPVAEVEKEIVVQEVEKEVIKTVEIEKKVIQKVYIKKEQTGIEKYGGWIVSGIFGFFAGSYINQNKDYLCSLITNVGRGLRLV